MHALQCSVLAVMLLEWLQLRKIIIYVAGLITPMIQVTEWVNTLLPFRLPPDQTLDVLLHNANYQLAARYLTLDLGLLLMLLVWGAAALRLLQRAFPDRKSDADAVSFSPDLSVGLPVFQFALLCGFAVLMAELFLLSACHAFTRTVLMSALAVTTLVALIYLFSIRGLNDFRWLPVRGIDRFWGLLLFIVLIFYQFSAPSDWQLGDATSFHVPYAEFILQQHGLGIPQDLIYPYHSLNLNVFYSLALLVEHELTFVQVQHALFTTLTLAALCQLAILCGVRRFIVIGLMWLFVSDYTIYYARWVANVDNGSMYFITLSALAIYCWQQVREDWLLCVSAVALGLAMGTKYLVCAFVLPMAVVIVMVAGVRQCARPLLLYACWVVAFGAWWYVRNWLLTGNPVHPLAMSVFGYYSWDQDDLNSQMGAWVKDRIPLSPLNILLAPYFAFVDDTLRLQGSFLLIVLLYFSTLLSFWSDRRLRILLVIIWCYFFVWLFSYQDPRYLQPVMPLILVYAGHLLSRAVGWLGHFFSRWMNNVAVAVVTVALVAMLALFLEQQVVRVFFYQLQPGEEREAAMRQNPEYELVTAAMPFFGRDEPVYEFFLRNARWFYDGKLVGTQFGERGYERTLREATGEDGALSAQRLHDLLRSRYQASGFIIPGRQLVQYDQDAFDRYFELKYRNSLGSVYRFRDVPSLQSRSSSVSP